MLFIVLDYPVVSLYVMSCLYNQIAYLNLYHNPYLSALCFLYEERWQSTGS